MLRADLANCPTSSTIEESRAVTRNDDTLMSVEKVRRAFEGKEVAWVEATSLRATDQQADVASYCASKFAASQGGMPGEGSADQRQSEPNTE